MLNQSVLSGKRFPAVVAFIGLFTSMPLVMLNETAFISKRFITRHAAVQLLASMCPEMPLQTPFAGKTGSAYFTFIGFLPRVPFFMAQEVKLFLECHAA